MDLGTLGSGNEGLEYIAKFQINCGINSNIGQMPLVKFANYSFKSSNEDPYFEAMYHARRFSEQFEANPETQSTIVELIGLESEKSQMPLNQYKKLSVECHEIEHLLKIKAQKEQFIENIKKIKN